MSFPWCERHVPIYTLPAAETLGGTIPCTAGMDWFACWDRSLTCLMVQYSCGEDPPHKYSLVGLLASYVSRLQGKPSTMLAFVVSEYTWGPIGHSPYTYWVTSMPLPQECCHEECVAMLHLYMMF